VIHNGRPPVSCAPDQAVPPALRAEQKIRRRVVCFTAARLTGSGVAYQLEAIAT